MEIILVLRGGGVCFLHIFLTAPSRPENIICRRDQTLAQNAKFWLNVNEESWRFIVTFLDLRAHARTNPVRLLV